MSTTYRMAACAYLVLLAVSTGKADTDLLSEGNKEFLAENYSEAIELYESSGSRENFLTRKYNAAVAYLKKGRLDRALSRLEEVSARSDGELSNRARYNLGYVHFQKGAGIAEKAMELTDCESVKEIDEKIEKLLTAAESYRNALTFYRKVDPPDPDTEHSIAVTKKALMGVMDEVFKLRDKKKEKRQQELLKDPAQLLRALIQKEKLNQRVGRSLKQEQGGEERLACRRLRKAEAENRALAEKLLFYLKKGPEQTQKAGSQKNKPQSKAQKQDQEKEAQRKAQAAKVVAEGVKAQKQAEVAYGNLNPEEAWEPHQTAIAEFRTARTFFPLSLAQLVKEGIASQEGILNESKGLKKQLADNTQPQRKGKDTENAGAGRMLLDTLGDKLLKPIAKIMSPTYTQKLKFLAEDEKEVVWAGEVLSKAKLPQAASSAGKAGNAANGPGKPSSQAGQPQAKLGPEEAALLGEEIRNQGGVCKQEAMKTKQDLSKGSLLTSIPHQEKALAALRKIAELLPKPPKTVEDKLRELIQKQKEAERTAEGMKELSGEKLSQAAGELAEAQRKDGKKAGEIAQALKQRKDDKARKALPKVREGERHIFVSGESLSRAKPLQAKESIKKDIKALEEALAILTGRKKKQEQGGQKQQQKQKKGEKKQQQKEKRKKTNYRLSPRVARMKREEMDRRRRQQEKKLFRAPSTVTVEKDW